MIKVAIGVDRREMPAYHVAAHSIMRRSSAPVAFLPISLDMLGGIFTRPTNNIQSTEFSFSRFLVPFLCDYEGWALFIDCDVVILKDITELWNLRDDRFAVMCVKHQHEPDQDRKFLGEVQTRYEKKNWSSVMLMNCEKCRDLTPEYVNSASGLELHRFQWLSSDDLIGALPPSWNHLVGYSSGELKEQSLLHYTEGGPYFADYRRSKWSEVWIEEMAHLAAVQERKLSEA